LNAEIKLDISFKSTDKINAAVEHYLTSLVQKSALFASNTQSNQTASKPIPQHIKI